MNQPHALPSVPRVVRATIPAINGLFATDRPDHEAVEDGWGRSESLDPDNVGDIADESAGHRD
jgi:hypothetical protein